MWSVRLDWQEPLPTISGMEDHLDPFAGLTLPTHLLGTSFNDADAPLLAVARQALVPQTGIQKTSEVSTPAFLGAVFMLGRAFARKNETTTHWASRWDVETWLDLPERIVLSKARALIKAGLMDGCVDGCRGDFELTDAGYSVLFSAQ